VQAGAAYLAARVAAFIAAHGTVCLCGDCVARILPKRVRKTRRTVEPGWCESCGSHAPDVFRLALSEYGRALRRRTAPKASRTSDQANDGLPLVTARCPICSGVIDPHDAPGLVFRPDGRVEHSRCPDPVCPWCLQTVAPSQPKLRSGREIFHRDCLRASWSERAIAGGSAGSAWTAIFDERCGSRTPPTRETFDELRAVTRQIREEAIGLRALARSVRSQSRSAMRRYWNTNGMRTSPSGLAVSASIDGSTSNGSTSSSEVPRGPTRST
jgi:hypothetical protein